MYHKLPCKMHPTYIAPCNQKTGTIGLTPLNVAKIYHFHKTERQVQVMIGLTLPNGANIYCFPATKRLVRQG
jgi:hypothetical protein